MQTKRTLLLTMLKIGLFTFGGGYAMLALLQNEFVEKRRWLTRDEFLDMAAVAESTPGPIAVNAATYIGYRLFGVVGALLATFAVCLPSFVVIYAVSLFFDTFVSMKLAAYAFKGVQMCVVYLILSAGWKLFKQMEKTVWNVSILSGVLLGMTAVSLFAVRFSTVFFILICGALGLLSLFFARLRGKEGGQK